ncbi:pyocin activator PrtN family protein [Variovorax sp. GB1P17]|uniref:pyocin activator PrtN family protein n=1 Tax=Variovorax sp. GB1P17 TaxID=3443740 RepID=UPI003F47CE1F
MQRDFFSHLEVKKLAAKCITGEIKLPLVRTDPSSQKSLKGVETQDLARYLDDLPAGGAQKIGAACCQMTSGPHMRAVCFFNRLCQNS